MRIKQEVAALWQLNHRGMWHGYAVLYKGILAVGPFIRMMPCQKLCKLNMTLKCIPMDELNS